jgi:sugar phosphate isomerase/epimerase
MRIGICSYSFHRLLDAGRQDALGYVAACKELGATQVDPWSGHLPFLDQSTGPLTVEEMRYLLRVRESATAAGLPIVTLAVDGAHVYEPDADRRATLRAKALRALDAAAILGAAQIRIDAGGPKDQLPADVFDVIQAGYRDLIDRAAPRGIQVLVENHRGATTHPDHLMRLLEAIPGLGLLLDSDNWQPGLRDEGRRRCAAHASAVHIKTYRWDAAGNEISDADVPGFIELLKRAKFNGPWEIESVPAEGEDEIAAARNAVGLLRKLL